MHNGQALFTYFSPKFSLKVAVLTLNLRIIFWPHGQEYLVILDSSEVSICCRQDYPFYCVSFLAPVGSSVHIHNADVKKDNKLGNRK